MGERVDELGRGEVAKPRGRSAAATRARSGRGPEPSLVVVGQELRLVGGHVDVDGAVALAAFAREAEIERVADRLRAPAVLDGESPWPSSISNNSRERPRGECSSSIVAW